MVKIRVHFHIILVAFILVGCGTTVRMHADYKQYVQKNNEFIELPCDAEIELRKFNGQNERLYEDEKMCKRNIETVIRNEMGIKGFRHVDIDNNIDTLDENFRYRYYNLLGEVNKLYNELYSRPILPKKKAYNIDYTFGSGVNFLADYYNADLLVFSTMRGYKNSTGENAKNVGKTLLIGVLTLGSYIPIYSTSGGVIYVTIVDGNTGNVIWANYSQMPTFGPTAIQNVLNKLLTNFNKY